MNYIYDIVLNFFDLDGVYEFYEWDKNDNYDYIEKIPIYKINSIQLDEIDNNIIKISKEFLNNIYNKTCLELDRIDYSMLITDSFRVIGLKFNEDGYLIKKSYLLLDEEDVVIEEVNDLELDILEYIIISKLDNNSFLTRRERYIQKYLLNEINRLYNNKDYDEINYLYGELFYDKCSIKDKYKVLINNIRNNYDDRYNTLYEIIELANSIS